MSSDNASSTVTYMSVSSDSNGPSSWGIPLVNAGEILELDPYEEVAQQGQAHLLSPAYVPDPIKLDEHVPVYVPELEHPEYHAPSVDDIQAEDQPNADDASPTADSPGYIDDSDTIEEDTDEDSIDYLDEPEDGEEDDDEDSEEDPEEDPSKDREPEDDDDDDDTDDADEEPTKDEEEEEHLASTGSFVVHCILIIIRIMPVTRQGANDAMTPESIQAMIDRAIQRNSTHTQDDASHNSGGGLRRPMQPACICSYPDFMKFQPLNFKGTEGIVGLSQWIKKMESVFYISGCAVENQVKFATCTLLGSALTWWNGHVRGNDVAAYTQRFQELALMCTKFLTDETAKIDKYIGGLPFNIHGNVMSARPKTLDFAIELANDLMDQ
ncbi:hypothetical protein Tco_0449278 [Tanacetum coccineum]